MRKVILISLAGAMFLGACKKSGEGTPTPATPTTIPPVTQLVTAQADTIPDGAMVKIKLQLDSVPIDETALTFERSASGNFSSSQDAVYFPGFGKGSLCSVTRDGVDCAIQVVPITPGKAIPLKITARLGGVYTLKTSYTKMLPRGKGLWLKDAYRKDSLNIRIWNYRFDIIKSDTNSYSAGRFSIVVR